MSATTYAQVLLSSPNLNFNSFRPIMNTGAPAWNPTTQYLTIGYRLQVTFQYNPATTAQINKVRTYIVQPLKGATALNGTTALGAIATTAYAGDPSFLLGGPPNIVRPIFDDVQTIVSIDKPSGDYAVEMIDQKDGLQVFSTEEYPVLYCQLYGAGGNNMTLDGFLLLEYNVIDK